MLHSSIVVLFLSSILVPVCISTDEPNFIDLSDMDYAVKSQFGLYIIKFFSRNENFKVKCPLCTDLTRYVQCQENQVTELEIDMMKENVVIPISFNITCGLQTKNIHSVSNLDGLASFNNISFSWSPQYKVKHYFVYFIENNGHYTKTITNEISYTVKNLREKSWYQICISSVNHSWQTSKFTCKIVLTDFISTGPVTNVSATSEIDMISISWSNPEYKHDIPQAYIIRITGELNLCHIIKMTNKYINIHGLCTDPQILAWETLQNLTINELNPYSKFDISITPLNKNKQSTETRISIKTKEGESDSVQNITIELTSPDWLSIQFHEPVKPRGKIIKYKLLVVLTKTNMCNKVNKVINEEYFSDTFHFVKTNRLEKCGSYLFTIFPINGWSENGGVGKPSSAMYNHIMKKYSTVKVDAKFISSNSVKVILKNVKHDNECETVGFVSEITNENNRNNCVTRISSSYNCTDMTRIVGETLNCKNIELENFDKTSSNLEIHFIGTFHYRNYYKIKLSIIKDVIEEVASMTIEANDIQDCFTDCYNSGEFYRGIKSVSARNTICKQWKDSSYFRYESTKSNLCSTVSSNKPWCPNKNSYAYCDVPACSNINSVTGCVKVLRKKSDTQSIRIQWFPLGDTIIIGYITLVYNTHFECDQYNIQLCNSCPRDFALQSKIRNFYLPCKSGRTNYVISHEAYFENLHENRIYFVFIIPIVSLSSYGEVKNITISTHFAKPHVPTNVSIISESLHEIEISWNKPYNTNQFGKANYYFVIVRKSNSLEETLRKVQHERIKMADFEICTQYCFILYSINNAGQSEMSNEICTYTRAPKPTKVELEDIKSGYLTNQIVKWKYSTNNNCAKIFLVEYQIKFMNEQFHISTKSMNTTLTNLKRNVIYTVKVRSENLMKTINNDNFGQYSEIREFYTGIEKPFISSFTEILSKSKKSLNILWTLDDEIQGSIFEFIIILKNSTNICAHLIHVMCTNCEDPMNQKYLTEDQSKSRKKLLNCTHTLKETFYMHKTSFYYLLEFEEILDNAQVEIFGINLLGIHRLNTKDMKFESRFTMAILIIIISLLICLILLLVLIRLRKNPVDESSFVYKNKNRGGTNNILMSNLRADQIRKAISVKAFPAYHNHARINGNAFIIAEYKKLSNKSKSLQTSLGLTVEAGKASCNRKKNRFANILPFDQSRVKIGDKVSPHDYINASSIPFASDENSIEYIALQGPIDETLAEFWQLIWEQNISCIVMLTKATEGNKFKCSKYWPNYFDDQLLYGFENQYIVTLDEEEEHESFVERDLIIENKITEEKRNIKQLHMLTWSSHSVPSLDHFDKLLFRFHELNNENITHPYLIHCCSGVARTGSFICIDRIIKQLLTGCEEINIYQSFLKLQKYRNFIDKKQVGYVFIYDYINHFLTKYMDIIEVQENLYINQD